MCTNVNEAGGEKEKGILTEIANISIVAPASPNTAVILLVDEQCQYSSIHVANFVILIDRNYSVHSDPSKLCCALKSTKILEQAELVGGHFLPASYNQFLYFLVHL